MKQRTAAVYPGQGDMFTRWHPYVPTHSAYVQNAQQAPRFQWNVWYRTNSIAREQAIRCITVLISAATQNVYESVTPRATLTDNEVLNDQRARTSAGRMRGADCAQCVVAPTIRSGSQKRGANVRVQQERADAYQAAGLRQHRHAAVQCSSV